MALQAVQCCPYFPQVTCVGHIIGAVVADTQLHAQRAAKAVKIKYEELKPIVTIQVGVCNYVWL